MKADKLKRLSKIEAQLVPNTSPVAAWLEACRQGASIAERNKSAGSAWVALATERHRLADETWLDYGEIDGDQST